MKIKKKSGSKAEKLIQLVSYFKKRVYQLNPGQGWIQEFFVGGGHFKKLQKMTSAPKTYDSSYANLYVYIKSQKISDP